MDVPRRVGVVASTSSCGPSATITWKSGERIKRVMVDAGGGALAVYALHDTELGVDCSFRQMLDTSWRCVPASETLGFADAGCTEPVVLHRGDKCGVDRHYASALGGTYTCGGTRLIEAVYETDGTAPLPEGTPVYRGSPASCSEQTVYTGMLVSRAHQLENGALAGGTLTALPAASGVVVEVVDGDDGSRGVVGLRDEPRDLPCDTGMSYDLATRQCVPTPYAVDYEEFFSDAGCTRRVARGGACASDIHAVFVPDATCGQFDLRAVEAPTQLDALYVQKDGACIFDATTSGDWLPVGDVIAEGTFGVTHDAELGSSRIVAAYEVTSGGEAIAFHGFIDTDYDAGCQPVRTADGRLRCVPFAELDETTFSDPGCTEVLVESYAPKEACGEFVGASFVATSNSGCERSIGPIREVLDFEARATVYRRDADGACAAVTPDSRFRYARIGDEVSPSEFVEIASTIN